MGAFLFSRQDLVVLCGILNPWCSVHTVFGVAAYNTFTAHWPTIFADLVAHSIRPTQPTLIPALLVYSILYPFLMVIPCHNVARMSLHEDTSFSVIQFYMSPLGVRIGLPYTVPGGNFQFVVQPGERQPMPRLPTRFLLPRCGDLQRHRGVHRRLLLPRERRLPHPVR